MRLEYDLIIVRGGLGRAVLSRAMAEYGARVLVIERECQFKDPDARRSHLALGCGRAAEI